MKRTAWPILKLLTAATLMCLALALLIGGCSLLGASSSPASGSTTLSSRTVESSHPATSAVARPPGLATPSSTSLRPPKSTTTTLIRATGDAKAIARKLGPSVVGVTAVLSRSRTETREALGTGVVYSATGLIITNNHVITGESATPSARITVTLSNGKTLAATLVGRDPTTDLAVLRVRAHGLFPAVFRTDLSALAVGDFAVAMGNPRILAHPVVSGHVTAFLHHVRYKGLSGVHDVVESDVPLAHGNSGGPLADALGRVIGIDAAEVVGEKAAVTLPSDLVIRIVKRLVATE